MGIRTEHRAGDTAQPRGQHRRDVTGGAKERCSSPGTVKGVDALNEVNSGTERCQHPRGAVTGGLGYRGSVTGAAPTHRHTQGLPRG